MWEQFCSKFVNPFATDNTLLCGWRLERVKVITTSTIPSSISSSNSEANASESLENIEKDFRVVWIMDKSVEFVLKM